MLRGLLVYGKAAVSVLLPRLCPSCQARLQGPDELFCAACLPLCKEPSEKLVEKEFRKKFFAAAEVDAFSPLFIFEYGTPVQHLVHSIKYGGMFRSGYLAGILAGKALLNRKTGALANLVVPVPLYHTRKSSRGFNQSDYIARGVAAAVGAPVQVNALRRVRDTQTQTHLNKLERKDNMRGAFIPAAYAEPAGATIILVDDVVTTGATVSECAGVLKRKGAGRVIAVSVGLAE